MRYCSFPSQVAVKPTGSGPRLCHAGKDLSSLDSTCRELRHFLKPDRSLTLLAFALQDNGNRKPDLRVAAIVEVIAVVILVIVDVNIIRGVPVV